MTTEVRTETLEAVAERAAGLFVSIADIEDNNRYAAGAFIRTDIVANRLRELCRQRCGRHLHVAESWSDANLFEAGNGFTDVGRFFADDIESMVCDDTGTYWAHFPADPAT